MNKKQIDVEKAKLADEKKVLDALKKQYMQAADDVAKKISFHTGKIDALLSDWDNLDEVEKSILQSQIYQRKYQQSLQKQIGEIIDNMNYKQYQTVEAYLKGCYETGFLGSLYDIHGQGIPIIIPINQKAMVKAVTLDSKVSKKLYGSYVDELKKRIQAEVSRGVAANMQYSVIARNLNMQAGIGFNKAMRIARTEGGKIRNSAAYNAALEAKEKGADIVLQWDAALDKRTRDSHRRVDGEIVELGERFSNGLLFPCDPAGAAGEVINCRCAALQRARWALDDDELETLKERAAFYGLDKTENFNDFKQKYLKIVENDDKIIPQNVLMQPIESSEEHYKYLLDKLKSLDAKVGCKYNPVHNHTKAVSEQEIIEALAGGDKTKGSCASLGLAYIGQKQGWNILDFRGGESLSFFSRVGNLHKLSLADGLKVLKAEGASSMTVGNRLLKQCEEGKEYYLCVGRHASIVRKNTDGVLQYLELQHPTKNGWTDFNGNPRYTLKTRFGCTQTSGSSAHFDFMIDLNESNFNTDDFKSLLGYINTAENEQRKGTSGTIK